MKNKSIISLLLLVSTSLFSQQLESLKSNKNLELNELKKDSDSIIETKQDSLVNTTTTDSLHTVLVQEQWDNSRFNPYHNQQKQFPFQIEFKDSIYASPIKRKKIITSRYGWRRGRPHRGIDIDLVIGDPVMAMFDGIIRFAKYSSGHGKTVVIRHYNGLETAYAHLSKYSVKANDTVKKGQIIGKGGITGNARGSHLHLIVSYKGNYINPEYLFDFGKENKIRKQNIWITKYWATARFHSSKKQSDLLLLNTKKEALLSEKKQKKRQIYIIKPGDTLSEISNKYHISLANLCKTNAISRNSILKIGKKLIIQ